MFLCISTIAGTGFLIKYTLIPGQDRWIVYGSNVNLYLFGMDRHQWGNIHLTFGFILLGLLILHIILHWNMIICVYNKIIKKKWLRKTIALLFVLICAFLIIFSFLLKPKVNHIGHGAGRQIRNYDISTASENKAFATHKNEDLNKINALKTQNISNPTIEIKGYMNIDEISKKYKVPSEFIKTKLNIPKSISDLQSLGWLKKKYGFKMSEVEDIITKYQKENK